MTQSDYSNLKEHVIVSFVNGNISITELKELFKDVINSIRRFDKITTIGELLKTLELRGHLSEDDVGPLKEIAKKTNSNELLRRIDTYEKMHVPQEKGSCYSTEKQNLDASTGGSILKKQLIFNAVTEAIGSSWRQLARQLKIPEYVVDQIDFDSKTLRTKSTKMMEVFDQRVNPQTWYFSLCDALENIPRRDILRTIREIMVR